MRKAVREVMILIATFFLFTIWHYPGDDDLPPPPGAVTA